jgi:hypothetical protein
VCVDQFLHLQWLLISQAFAVGLMNKQQHLENHHTWKEQSDLITTTGHGFLQEATMVNSFITSGESWTSPMQSVMLKIFHHDLMSGHESS